MAIWAAHTCRLVRSATSPSLRARATSQTVRKPTPELDRMPYNGQSLGYLTVWPKGEPQPLVSTLNNLTGTIVANAAIRASRYRRSDRSVSQQ